MLSGIFNLPEAYSRKRVFIVGLETVIEISPEMVLIFPGWDAAIVKGVILERRHALSAKDPAAISQARAPGYYGGTAPHTAIADDEAPVLRRSFRAPRRRM